MLMSVMIRNMPKYRAMCFQNIRYSTKVYLDTHEWFVRENKEIKLGLSAKAIELMNDIVYVEDDIDTETVFNKGDPICTIESVKAVSEMYSPVKCKILAINEDLLQDLEELNENPEKEDNWILKLEELS